MSQRGTVVLSTEDDADPDQQDQAEPGEEEDEDEEEGGPKQKEPRNKQLGWHSAGV